jgi:hypothetical protein
MGKAGYYIKGINRKRKGRKKKQEKKKIEKRSN